MRRVCSIWLPYLAIERWAKSSDFAPEAPVVLTVEGTHGPVIHAVTKAAAERGARPGARLTDARALDPALIAIPADPAGDGALLERLARWAGRWSPLVEVDGDGSAARRQRSRASVRRRGGLADDVRARFAAARADGADRHRPDCRRGLGAGAISALSTRGRGFDSHAGERGERCSPRSPPPPCASTQTPCARSSGWA